MPYKTVYGSMRLTVTILLLLICMILEMNNKFPGGFSPGYTSFAVIPTDLSPSTEIELRYVA